MNVVPLLAPIQTLVLLSLRLPGLSFERLMVDCAFVNICLIN